MTIILMKILITPPSQIKLVKRRTSNRKAAKPRFDSRYGSASQCFWERHLMLFPKL